MKPSPLQRRWFAGAAVSLILAAAAALLTDAVLARIGLADRPLFSESAPMLSERSRAILTDTDGTLGAVCLMPSDAPNAAPVGRLLRIFAGLSKQLAGADIRVIYADPRTDPAAAAQWMARGAEGLGILIHRAGRSVFVPESALCDHEGRFDAAEAEPALAAAILRMGRPDGIPVVWLTGHGEPDSADTHVSDGFSALRRTLENEGFAIRPCGLTGPNAEKALPQPPGLLIIAEPRYPVTVAERILLSDWLDRGGRLLCLMPATGDAGLAPLLERWGIRLGTTPRLPRSLSTVGSGMTRTLNKEHAVTRELAGRALVEFTAPRAILPATGTPDGSFTPLATLTVSRPDKAGAASDSEPITPLAAAERGGTAGTDLAFRPGRLVVAGEAAFLKNRHLLNHASANRDLAANIVRWLGSLPGSGAPGSANIVSIGQTSREWRMDRLISVLILPALICLILWLFNRRRV